MGLVLRYVPGFGTYPDGRLRAGPFNADGVGMLYLAMDKWGIRPGAEGSQGIVSQTPEGIMLSAQGEGVTGYLLDAEGLESSRSDLDGFILETVRPGAACRINGHWCPDPDRMIVSEATAVHDGRYVTWVETRDILHRDGRRQNISRSLPVALPAQRALRIA
ncbi:hypothetical protein [Leisingera caerulea]|uniref:hypothetical protein n=1 Tax=Leisingera caerulea TaxID=506591 RepID=UPI000418F8B2|nr:hypothetical protein [Leisingera caerulea]